MPFALIQENGELSKIIDATRIEWGGAYHSCLPKMKPEERKKFLIYDVIDLAGNEPPYGISDGQSVIIDHTSGTVTRTNLWKTKTIEEAKSQEIDAIKRKAADVLRDTDWRMIRALEQAMATVLPAEDKALADEREAIRMASDTAEAAVYEAATLTELKAVAAFEPTVIEGVKG